MAKKNRVFLERLDTDKDLLEEITKFAKNKNVKKGIVKAIGAVSEAKIGYYDQNNEEYQYTKFKQHLEIVSLLGNISILDGEIMVHAHIALADEEGNMYGGHLAEGTKIFATELYLEEISGDDKIRKFDKDTGLTLW
ncbi:MAG: PPC domain-containing DNA-binding protein [Bacillota bacterium]